MKTQIIIATIGLLFLSSCSDKIEETMSTENTNKEVQKDTTEVANEEVAISQTGSLGAFSMSLSVKDLAVSKKFYEDLGFTIKGGGMEMNYLVMKNGNTLIGLFQGMFEGNIITFNPGWDESGDNLENFTDVRTIQQNMIEKGVQIDSKIETPSEGPASIMFTDPDGNLILIDQHR